MVPLERLGDPESVVPGLQFDEVPGEGPDAASGALPMSPKAWRFSKPITRSLAAACSSK